MNFRHTLGSTAVMLLGMTMLLGAQAAATAQGNAPKKQSVAMPVALAGSPEGSTNCVVSRGPTVPISAVAFSPDGKMLAVGGYQEVLLWDLAQAKLAKRIAVEQSSAAVRAVTFLNDGKSLAVGAGTPYGSGVVKIVDVQSGEPTATFEEPKDVVCALAKSPDGKLLAASGADTVVYVWNVAEKKLVATLKEHNDWVLGLSFSGDGKFLLTASADQTAKIWDVAKWNPVNRFVHDDTCHGAVLGSDGQMVLVAVGGAKEWSIRQRRRNNVRSTRRFSTGGGMPLDLVWVAKTNMLYVPCSDNTVKGMTAYGKITVTFNGHQDWVYCTAVNSEGTRLASGSADGTVKLWNLADGKLLATLMQLTPKTDEWLIMTAQGYQATSTPGALKWKMNDSTPPDKLVGVLQNPELVQKAIAGEKNPPPALPKM